MRMFQQSKTQMGLLGQMLALERVGYENPKTRTSPLHKVKTFKRVFKNQSPERLAAAIAKRERKGEFRFNQYVGSLSYYHPSHKRADRPEWWAKRIIALAPG